MTRTPRHPQPGRHTDGWPLEAAGEEITFTKQLPRSSAVFVLGKNVMKILVSGELSWL